LITIVHCKRASFDVYIGRATTKLGKHETVNSMWHNPFSIAKHGRGKAIRLYEKHIRKLIADGVLTKSDFATLKDKVLGCWCHNKSCHGRVLIMIYREFFGNDIPVSMLLG